MIGMMLMMMDIILRIALFKGGEQFFENVEFVVFVVKRCIFHLWCSTHSILSRRQRSKGVDIPTP